MRSVLINFCFQSHHQHLSLNSIAASSTFFDFPLFLPFDEISSHFSSSTSMSNFSIFFFIFGTSMKVLCSYFFSFVFITEENEKRERRKMERSLWEILKMGKNSNNKNINSNRKIFFARSWDVIACEWDFVT